MKIITKELLAETFIKNVLSELLEEYYHSGLNLDYENGTSFDEFVWNRLEQLGRATYEQIGEMYGDLDDALDINKVVVDHYPDGISSFRRVK